MWVIINIASEWLVRVFFVLTEPCSMEVTVTAQVSLLPAAMVPHEVFRVFLTAITRSVGLDSETKREFLLY